MQFWSAGCKRVSRFNRAASKPANTLRGEMFKTDSVTVTKAPVRGFLSGLRALMVTATPVVNVIPASVVKGMWTGTEVLVY